MPNLICFSGPAFSLTGDLYFSNNDVNFNIAFDDESGAAAVLAFEWYLDSTLLIGQNALSFASKVDCGSHTVGVRILSSEGWSGIKDLTFNTCKVPTSIFIYGPDSLNEGASADYSIIQSYSDGSNDDLTDQYTFGSTTGGSFNGHTFSATVDDTSYTSTQVTITAAKDGATGLVKQVTVNNTTQVTLVSLAITGPDTVNEGLSGSYAVLANYSDGSQKDMSAAYVFSTTEGSFTGAVLSISANNVINDTRVITVSASTGANQPLTKQVTVTDTTQITIVSLALTGPDTINEGLSGSYAVLASYSDGSQKDLSAAYVFSTTEGSFTGTVLSIPVNSAINNTRVITVSASIGANQPLTKQVTVNDASQVTIVSLVLTGSDTVNEGSSGSYAVLASYSDGSQKDLSATYVFTATEGSFTGTVLSIPVNNALNDTRVITVSASAGSDQPLSKQVTINDKSLKAGILVVDLFDDSSLNVIGFLDNAEISGNHVAAYTGHNISPATALPAQAIVLASDLNTPASTKWRFEFNLAKVAAENPATTDLVFYIKGRGAVAGTLAGAFSLKNNDAIMVLTGSAGAYIPSVTGGSNIFTLINFNTTVVSGANGSYAEGDLTNMMRFVYNVPSNTVTRTNT